MDKMSAAESLAAAKAAIARKMAERKSGLTRQQQQQQQQQQRVPQETSQQVQPVSDLQKRIEQVKAKVAAARAAVNVRNIDEDAHIELTLKM